jgi:ribose-phosphate pyrophosphokinase
MPFPFVIVSGSANTALAEAIARVLGIRTAACEIRRFPDGEVSIELGEPVRGHEVFLVQPTAPPVDTHLVELLALADACRRAAATRITAVIPYFGYARADKRLRRREPVTARMVADLLQLVGIEHVVTVDLHTDQVEGFFHVPVDALTAVPTLGDALANRLPKDAVVVAPDAGRVRMATRYANFLNAPVIVLHKQRRSGTETAVTHVVGDVRSRACLIIDDMISTGGTIANSIDVLLDAGARPEIWIAATHGLLLDGAREKLGSTAVRELLITDTVALHQATWPQLKVISVAPLIAAALQRIHSDGSFSELYRSAQQNPKP